MAQGSFRHIADDVLAAFKVCYGGRHLCGIVFRRVSGIGASRPRRRIETKVSLLNPEPPLSIGGGMDLPTP